MQFLEIFIYSIIQGFTEFLPISSSAHLYFLEDLFNWTNNGVIYALAAHLGTLLAVVFYQKNNLYSLIKDSSFTKKNTTYIIYIFIASLPVILIGGIVSLFFSDIYKSKLIIIGSASIFGGLLLDFSDRYKQSSKIKKKISFQMAVITGFFQILALIPGMSRSGTVITALRLCSLNRNESIKFSLLSGIPILMVASLYSFYELNNTNENISYAFLIISFLSFFSALFSIKFIFSWTRRFSFRIFSVYRIIFGILIFIYLLY
tara:strand:+ start:186 stop:968 length:783 start_codon:yes stop_codon:yes gene_type:complete